MKIVHVITHLSVSSGAAKLLASLIPYQIEQGHQVDVIALVDSPHTYVCEIENCGCHFTSLGHGKNKRYSLANIIKLMPYLNKSDIVHVHLFPSLYWAVFAKILSRATCRLVVTEHSTLNNRQRKWYLKACEKFVYNQYDCVIAISNGVKECLQFYVDKQLPVEVIENGIQVEQIQQASSIPRSLIDVPANAKLIIQVAGFRPQKDQLTLIKALKRLPDYYQVIFVGEGPTLAEHQQKVTEWGLDNRVHFLGLREDVPALLKTADIVVMSSHFEGFGLAAVEGMAAGKPVIASDVPGLQDVVQGAGILFPAHNDKILADEILKLSIDKSYVESVIDRCFSRAREYDIKIMAQKYDSIYQRIINN